MNRYLEWSNSTDDLRWSPLSNEPVLLIVNVYSPHDCNRWQIWRYRTYLVHEIVLQVVRLCSSLLFEQMDQYERIPIEHQYHWMLPIDQKRIHRIEHWIPSQILAWINLFSSIVLRCHFSPYKISVLSCHFSCNDEYFVHVIHRVV